MAENPQETSFHQTPDQVAARENKVVGYIGELTKKGTLEAKRREKGKGLELVEKREAVERSLAKERDTKRTVKDHVTNFFKERVAQRPTKEKGMEALISDIQHEIIGNKALLDLEIELALERADITQKIAMTVAKKGGRNVEDASQLRPEDYDIADDIYNCAIQDITNTVNALKQRNFTGTFLIEVNPNEVMPPYSVSLEDMHNAKTRYPNERLDNLMGGESGYLRGEIVRIPTIKLVNVAAIKLAQKVGK